MITRYAVPHNFYTQPLQQTVTSQPSLTFGGAYKQLKPIEDRTFFINDSVPYNKVDKKLRGVLNQANVITGNTKRSVILIGENKNVFPAAFMDGLKNAINVWSNRLGDRHIAILKINECYYWKYNGKEPREGHFYTWEQGLLNIFYENSKHKPRKRNF